MIPSERTERVAEIVEGALECEPSGLSSFLEHSCGGDATLRAEAESLLGFRNEAIDFIELPAYQSSTDLLAEECGALKIGEPFAEYEILCLLGEGGMGEVYLAEDAQLGRKVAIKLVKPGLGRANLIRHFRQEERILAGLNHPNIARLYGGAVTLDGVPYFVMEYVEGERLDRYCDAQKLTLHQRLELFRKICSAVSYAHQHLIIHRDIKPANIRVAVDGEPKLLDFGIAKLLDAETAVSAEQTITLQGVMTPEYASPEQARGDNMTTASDVYSLGVVLYELLTGQRPYRTKSRRPEEVVRVIAEQEPARPSTAITKGENPKLDIRHSKFLKGDLDNIVLMALRKEPARRYSSVNQLSEDIRRHLEGLPVDARKDTFVYRTTKFIRRNRLGVAAAGIIVLSLLAGIVATAWQARAARKEKARAETVSAFLEGMLRHSNPLLTAQGKKGGQTTMLEALDEAARRIESPEFSDQPEVKAELEKIIGQAYAGQGRQDLWEKHLQEYISIQTRLHGEHDPKAIEATANWALLLFHKDLAASEKVYRKVLPLMREEYRKGNIKAVSLADALNNFGYLRRTQGDSSEAEAAFRETLALSAKIPPQDQYVVRLTKSTLASTLADQGRFDQALETARQAVAEQRRAGQTNTPDFGFALTILGGFLTDKGEFAEADSTLHEAEAIFRRLQIPSFFWLGDNLRNQGISLYRQAKYPEAQRRLLDAKTIYLEKFGPTYDNYPTVLIFEGLILDKTGRSSDGEAILREAVKLRTELLPKEHFWIALAHGALGECLTTQNRFEESEQLLLESHRLLGLRLGQGDPRTIEARQRLARLYELWGTPDRAARYRQ